MSYLGNLTLRLAAGAARLAEPLRRRHAAYLAGQQNADGGFSGQQGPSDPYYTGFALRGLALLGTLDGRAASGAAGFLQQRLAQATPLASIDFLSLVSSAVLLEVTCGIDVFAGAGLDRRKAVAAALEPLARDDGGYAMSQRSGPSSTYHTFLAAACLELVGLPLEQAPRMADLIRSRQRSDGGFVELDPMQHGGTNPTAAAVGLLRLLGALDASTAEQAAAFLARAQNLEGGLRANTGIPMADLLSTFTGLVALADLDALARVDRRAAQRYVETLELADGGFRPTAWDNATDVEYTFYGLGSCALLAAAAG